MDGIRIILVIVAIGIVVVNLFINSSNIFKIVGYCFQTNTLNKYWSLFFKNCVSFRALISSVFAMVLGIIIFLIITPIILIRRVVLGKKTNALVEEGLLFQYSDLDIQNQNLLFNSNFQSLTGITIDNNNLKVMGKIRIDATFVVSEIENKVKADNKEFSFKSMHPVALSDGREALIPIFVIIDKTEYPIYFIYNDTQKRQYNSISNKLYNRGYKCIYFSAVSM